MSDRIREVIAEARALDEAATDGPWQHVGGYLTTRDPYGHSFSMSIWHIDELGQAHPSAPFQSVAFARNEDAALAGTYRTLAPRLAAALEVAVAQAEEQAEDGCSLEPECRPGQPRCYSCKAHDTLGRIAEALGGRDGQ